MGYSKDAGASYRIRSVSGPKENIKSKKEKVAGIFICLICLPILSIHPSVYHLSIHLFPFPSLLPLSPFSCSVFLSPPNFPCFSGACGQSNLAAQQFLSLCVTGPTTSQRLPSNQVWPGTRVILFKSSSWRSCFGK